MIEIVVLRCFGMFGDMDKNFTAMEARYLAVDKPVMGNYQNIQPINVLLRYSFAKPKKYGGGKVSEKFERKAD